MACFLRSPGIMSSAAPAPSTHPARTGGGAWVPLTPLAPVSLRRSICLRSRLQSSSCNGCAQACPVGALRIGAAGVELQEGCTGCGRCQAACPVGAVVAHGFAGVLESTRADAAGELQLECSRFPDAPAHAQLPCLGGVTEASLLALCARNEARPVVLVDRGACAACDSGGPVHPARAVVERVAGWMYLAGVPQAQLPRIERSARSDAAAAPRGEDPLQSRGRARRGFLGALARPARPQAAATDPGTPREQVLALLATLAARHGGSVAPDLFHHLAVGASCKGLRVCAATCPTGALVRYRNDEAKFTGIAFDARDCIGCKHCAAVCPNHALQVLPGVGAGLGRRPLTRFVQRECTDCGARFAASAGDDGQRCDGCRKRAQLARAAFTTLFPARTPLQGME